MTRGVNAPIGCMLLIRWGKNILGICDSKSGMAGRPTRMVAMLLIA
jgi:hypothetical protein